MIQFFKKLIARLFGKNKPADIPEKPVIAPAIYPDPEKIEEMNNELISRKQDEVTKVKLVKEKRKIFMRNNRLLIFYNYGCMNGRMNGKIESLRCTKIQRAREIAKGIQSYCVNQIIFADANGQQFTIKSLN